MSLLGTGGRVNRPHRAVSGWMDTRVLAAVWLTSPPPHPISSSDVRLTGRGMVG